MFINCEKCNKKLIKKTKEGAFHFLFGKRYGGTPPVDMKIYGSIEMKCMKCDHVNNIKQE